MKDPILEELDRYDVVKIPIRFTLYDYPNGMLKILLLFFENFFTFMPNELVSQP